MAEGKAGGEAFSFPVTPVAEAPAPADTVFSAWPSFHKKRRQVRAACQPAEIVPRAPGGHH